MTRLRSNLSRSVIVLTALLAAGCSFVERQFQESCHSHAYTQQVLVDYISKRFLPNSPARLGIIPASVPANMSSFTNEQPGAGNVIAWRIHQDLLNFGEVPIVEVLNRHEWPGKKEEFFTGNFGAIRAAREAGYDLVLVSFLEPPRDGDSLSAYAKLIDVSNGVTLYYGKSTATTARDDLRGYAVPFGIMDRKPSLMYTNELLDKLGQCISQAVMKDSSTPR